MRYLDVHELGAVLGLKASTVRRKIRANSHEVPPRMHLPGTRMLRWRVQDVEVWMSETGWTPKAPLTEKKC